MKRQKKPTWKERTVFILLLGLFYGLFFYGIVEYGDRIECIMNSNPECTQEKYKKDPDFGESKTYLV